MIRLSVTGRDAHARHVRWHTRDGASRVSRPGATTREIRERPREEKHDPDVRTQRKQKASASSRLSPKRMKANQGRERHAPRLHTPVVSLRRLDVNELIYESSLKVAQPSLRAPRLRYILSSSHPSSCPPPCRARSSSTRVLAWARRCPPRASCASQSGRSRSGWSRRPRPHS